MKICPNCRTPHQDNVTFCPNCGTALGAASANVPQQPAYGNAPQQAPQQPAYGNVPPQAPMYGAPQQMYAQPPKKSNKGLVIGLVAGGVALLLIVAAVIAFFALSGSGKEEEISKLPVDESKIEQSKDAEKEPSEEEQNGEVLPTDPNSFDLAKSNPFLTRKDGKVSFRVDKLFFVDDSFAALLSKDVLGSMGVDAPVQNADGSVTVTMKESIYDLFMSSAETGFEIGYDSLAGSADFPSVKKIEANDTYTVIKVEMDRSHENVEVDEQVIGITASTIGGLHQMLCGVPAEMTKVRIQYIDSETGAQYSEKEYINPVQTFADLQN